MPPIEVNMPAMIDVPPPAHHASVTSLVLTGKCEVVFRLLHNTTDRLAMLCARGQVKTKDEALMIVQRVMLDEHFDDANVEMFKKDKLMEFLRDLNKGMPEYQQFTSLACIIEHAQNIYFTPEWMIGRYAVTELGGQERISYDDVMALVDTAIAEYEQHSVFLGSQVYAYHYACLMLILECADKCSFAAATDEQFVITFKRQKGV